MATKFETKSTITRLVQEISLRGLRLTGGIQGRATEWCQSNFKPPTLVAMARKFDTKQAITPLI